MHNDNHIPRNKVPSDSLQFLMLLKLGQVLLNSVLPEQVRQVLYLSLLILTIYVLLLKHSWWHQQLGHKKQHDGFTVDWLEVIASKSLRLVETLVIGLVFTIASASQRTA